MFEVKGVEPMYWLSEQIEWASSGFYEDMQLRDVYRVVGHKYVTLT